MKKQHSREKKIKIFLTENDIRQKDLIAPLKQKHPDLDIKEAHISKALSGKYPSMLDKIYEIIEGLA